MDAMSSADPHSQIDLLPVVPRRRDANQLVVASAAKAVVAMALNNSCAPTHAIANAARNNLPAVLENGCQEANGALKVVARNNIPAVLIPPANAAINLATGARTQRIVQSVVNTAANSAEFCANRTQTAVQSVANKTIDSDCCYGKETSYISRATRWLVSWL